MKITDILGKTYGRLLALTIIRKEGRGKCFVHCKCTCGKTTDVVIHSLQTGVTKSCGCLRAKRLQSLIGKKFGLLTVIGRDKNPTNLHRDGTPKKKSHLKPTYWVCKCECGNVTSIWGQSLKSGASTKCTSAHHKIKVLTGKRFGPWTVRELSTRPEGKRAKGAWYKCECTCGIEEVRSYSTILYGLQRKSGCNHPTQAKKNYTYASAFSIQASDPYEHPNAEWYSSHPNRGESWHIPQDD